MCELHFCSIKLAHELQMPAAEQEITECGSFPREVEEDAHAFEENGLRIYQGA